MALFGRRNPLFQILAVVLYWAGIAVFVFQAAPMIPNRYVGRWQWAPILLTLATNIASYVLACATSPGIVDPSNEDAACRVFPYDNLLYYADRRCRTCHTRKPARSKHCSVCGRCVQMMDHHCIWLNTCVGLHNVRWFLLFLASFSAVCIYGSYLFATVVLEMRLVLGLDRLLVWNDEQQRMEPLSFKSSLLYLLDDSPLLAIVLVLLLVLTPAVVLFCGYQVRISMLGYTNNEESKWLNVAEAIGDQVVYETAAPEGPVYEVIEKDEQPADSRPRRCVGSLAEVKNMYDHGAVGNLALLFFPPKTQPLSPLANDRRKAHQS
ncbi:DHHC palmitoyltransferase-domain-containing protein [Coemansia spiralis]|nr:DHHC palmitoyltransferase-domain-containing protein [Coemansia spiralis]